MDSINSYTIKCTENQTKKALELGASLQRYTSIPNFAEVIEITTSEYYEIPTAEQMIGWLRNEKGLFVEPYLNGETRYSFSPIISTLEDGEIIRCEAEDSYEKATLQAIDAALEYLDNNK